ncbi:hypothetical protein [Natronobacterium gregoryi]|uniref:Uncharacterized protein n=2 Tax=Natronobacterium gregoryi TaxID=44930 RepID=L0AGR2_NATGS|nr:hypothetical protein [Natronobacterium gregoryi]AFZ72270.1 hypothetical protein Natgr_1040 [Natronobacterium gregoryi SP2]ELY62330.1 hypothetical protein C490_18273 [Natronobacterium gregoryi SP2]PLK20218.1 hypothetical protein CYV19_11035 [Natronobacterium gregoryi SP2]SFJ29263.1 hypothetical protein SAMN05443661_12068 [Natronobacterium gregoryi]
MEEISLGVPEPLLNRLPDDDEVAAADMQDAVAGWERKLNQSIQETDDETEAATRVLEAVDRFEDRYETYDELVPELRAWGQSPIYAIAWRTLYADVIAQLYDHEELADHLERERNRRVVADGIRLQDL